MPKHILIIDDDPGWHELCKQILEGMPYELSFAGTGPEAKHRLREREYDLILLDLCLKGDAITLQDELLWQYLRKNHPKLPIMAVTGWPHDAEAIFKHVKSGSMDFAGLCSKGTIELDSFRKHIQQILNEQGDSSQVSETEGPIWLHLSDFHVGRDDYGQRRLFSYILDHVRRRVSAGQGPDLVFITGDIANRGMLTEYQQFFEQFLIPLKSCVGEECARRIYIVPGNHDVDRSQAEAVRTYGILSEIPVFLDPTREGLAKREPLLPRFHAFAHNDLTHTEDPHWLLSPASALIRDIQAKGVRFGILGVNTAWLSRSDDDRHRLSAGKSILETGLEQLCECQVRIVLGHHPIDWFLDYEIEPVRSLFSKHKVIYLHGHLHKARSHHESGAGRPFLGLQAGACFQVREHETRVNRLLWCRLDPEMQGLEVEPLHWARDFHEWVLDGSAFPPTFRQRGTDRWMLPLP